MPAGATLSGTADDDGQPTNQLTSTWSKVGGPGTVVFNNINDLNATATFDQPGTYTLRLTADDGQLSATDDVIITVNPAPPGNQAPSVNAGPDQNITLPANANLSGTANDDGQPNNQLTTTWSKVSGPGNVTFGDASALNTTATFSQDGSYVLRLTADDSQLSSTDDITVLVNAAPPGNQPPTVNAGADQTVTLPAVANLSGTANDDNQPNGQLTTTWSKVSGPGNVTFGNINTLNTTASFDQTGTYVLRLTADDTQLSASDDIAVTVNPAPTGSSTIDVRVSAGDDDAERAGHRQRRVG